MSTTDEGFVSVMRPEKYALMPPQKVALIEEYYENKCREKEIDISLERIKPILESLRRFFEKAPAIAPFQLMIGDVPYERIIRPLSSGEADSSEISEKELLFSKFILQRSYEPSSLSSGRRRHPQGYVGLASLEGSQSPMEVWNGSTRVRLCWNEHPVSPDDDANRCFQSMVGVDRFFRTVFRIPPVTDQPYLMRADIHYPYALNQVFWDTRDRKVLCGDFDPAIYTHSLAADPDVIVHAFSQAAVYYSSDIDHQRQGGAINESLADVSTIMEKHYRAGVSAGDLRASWNIGEGLITGAPRNSLRSMATPGSGFRGHPILEDDDQVGHMSEYRPDHPLDQDFGGVYKYSGIANRAFYLAATREAGFSWEKMGKIWHLALTHSQHNIDFAGFAEKTVEAAKELRFGEAIAHIVESSWEQVGVRIGMTPPPEATGTPPRASEDHPPKKRKKGKTSHKRS